ncbi:MAG TPA: hypothetical protein VGK67_41680 [Myxococcales bacterium]|jgi:hypothetical protein
MGFKVGQEKFVSISNLKKQAKEPELKKFDTNNDNLLDPAEQDRYYASTSKSGATPKSPSAVYTKAGGREHKVTQFARDYYQTLYTYAPDSKGNFSIPGFGAGNIRTGRQLAEKNTDAYNFLVDCDLMDKNFIENGVESATIVIGPKGFTPDSGSKLDEMVTIPLNTATADGYQSFNRGGSSTWIPEKKFLAASVDVKDLRKLAGDSGGLSFYVRLQTSDGKTLWMNKDGKAFKNFEIDAAELKARAKV